MKSLLLRPSLLVVFILFIFSCLEKDEVTQIPSTEATLLKSVKRDSTIYLEIEYDNLRRPSKKVFFPNEYFKSIQSVSYQGDSTIVSIEQFEPIPKLETHIYYKTHADSLKQDIFDSEHGLISKSIYLNEASTKCQFSKLFITMNSGSINIEEIHQFPLTDCSKQEVEIYFNGNINYNITMLYNNQKSPFSDTFLDIFGNQIQNCNYYRAAYKNTGAVDFLFSYTSEFHENEKGQVIEEVRTYFDGNKQIWSFEYYPN